MGVAVEPKQKKVHLWNDEITMNVKYLGDGPPILYFHPAAGLMWDEFLNKLSENYTVYAPQHPGTSDDYPDDIHKVDTISDLILMYEELIRKLGLEKPITIGQSFGGMVALELASHFPNLLERVIVLDPVGLWRDDVPVADWVTASGADLPELLFYNPESDVAQAMFKMPEDPELAIKAQASLGWGMACTAKFAWPIPDNGLDKRLHRIEVPTLIIWGEDDKLISSIYAEEFHKRIKNSTVKIFKECGHIPQMEKLEETYEAVMEFIK